MKRKAFLAAAFFGCSGLLVGKEKDKASVRGKLILAPGNRTALEVAPHRLVYLDGDEDSMKVVHDPRLLGSDFEALGAYTAPDLFRIDPIYTVSMFVYRGGKKLMITYWCDVCHIRTYAPGKCMCCQKETALDLRDPGEN